MTDLQVLCEQGQRELTAMDYLAAEATLAKAAEIALSAEDFDTLERVCLPLQEARRQRRQRCGEGVIRLGLVATGPNDQPNPAELIDRYPHGQLLIAGWESVATAVEFRRLAAERKLYVETFLGAVHDNVTMLVPLPDTALTNGIPLKPVISQTYAQTMHLWETLHTPYLSIAEKIPDPRQQIPAYLRVIQVDYACELAHQGLAAAAKKLK